MKIEAGKRYVMRYGGITAPLKMQSNVCWTDGSLSWFQSGNYGSAGDGPRDLIAEYDPHKPPCELRAGGKYTLDNGDVVTLNESGFTVPCVHRFLPLNCAGFKYGYVTCDGEVLGYHDKSETVARITGEFIEPKPPTPLERLEKLSAKLTAEECRSNINSTQSFLSGRILQVVAAALRGGDYTELFERASNTIRSCGLPETAAELDAIIADLKAEAK